MQTISRGKVNNPFIAIAIGLLLGSLSGCLSSSSGTPAPDSSTPPQSNSPLSGTMLTSTVDSGLTVTVGMPEGDIAKPASNPVTITTVPSDEQQAAGDYSRVQQDDSTLSYTGSWTSSVMPSTNTAAMESGAAGSQVNYTFTGTAVRWIGYRDAWSGVADVFLDGLHVATVDTYSTTPMASVVLYSASSLPDARHMLTIEAEGRHDSVALGAAVWVSAFDAKLSSPAQSSAAPVTSGTSNGYTRIEQDGSGVSYSGSWATQSSSLTADFSGGSATESETAGASATLAFDGTAVRWIGYADTFSGIADVYLDGTHVATVDTYSLLPASQVVMYSATGLAAGNHTLTIKADGRHSLLSLGSEVWVDAFDIIESQPAITPPTVTMTAPANSSTVSGKVTLSANATAANGAQIAGVQFELDGGALGSAVTSAPYSISWDSTTVANGSHTLTAVATDSAGNRSTAAPVSVTVSNSGGTVTPTVTMTAPASGSSVSGSVMVSANASDSAGIASVQFELDGSPLGSTVTAAPYSITWDSTTVANGSHNLSAVATDDADNKGTASPITITVSNGGSGGTPTVTMTAPTNGSTVSGSITVSANASDSAGIASVQFQLDGSPLGGPITSTPYSITWDSSTVANGSHSLSAVATDSAGNKATATPVTVTVSNGGGGSTPPTVSMTAPANGSTVSGSVTVSASAMASGTATITSVQFELDGAALDAPVTSAPYSVSWDSTTASNGSHSLAAIATDSAGNKSTASAVDVTVSNSSGGGGTTTRIEQDNPAVAYTGTWITASDSSVSGGTAAESNQANATATLTFTGTGVTWISYTSPNTAGISSVSVDGGNPTQVDTYTAATVPQAKVFSVSNLAKGTHTLKITVSGNFDRNGNSAYVVVDAFDVTD